MADRKTIGVVLIIVGLIVLLLSVLADPIGLGGGNEAFGPYQIVGTIVGVVVAIAGVYLMRQQQLR
jgi:hypothetical protein